MAVDHVKLEQGIKGLILSEHPAIRKLDLILILSLPFLLLSLWSIRHP
jgi:hypothetical protein